MLEVQDEAERTVIERGGKARMVHVQHATKAVVRDILVRNAGRKSTLHTDQSKLYTVTGEEYASHKTTNHSAGEYVRYEDGVSIHSNTIENVFSVFKRGMVGVYQHCGEVHLHRYLAEFDFRYNRRTAPKITNTERHDQLLAMIEDKRLTYRRIGEAGNGTSSSNTAKKEVVFPRKLEGTVLWPAKQPIYIVQRGG